jgi:hypothetical protein
MQNALIGKPMDCYCEAHGYLLDYHKIVENHIGKPTDCFWEASEHVVKPMDYLEQPRMLHLLA